MPQTKKTLPQSDETKLRRLEHESRAASLDGTLDHFAKVAVDEFLCIDPSGKVFSKAEALKSRRAGEMAFHSLQVEDEVIQAHNGWALVTGVSHVRGAHQGREFSSDHRYARIYAKRTGEWRLVFSQSTRIEAEAA